MYRVLVTGATSALGRYLLWLLKANNCLAIGVGRNPRKVLQLQQAGFECLCLDLTDPQTYSKLPKVEQVIHAAALSAPWGTYSDFYKQNVFVTELLAQWAKEVEVKRIIYLSSASVYTTHEHRFNILESEIPTQFINHYAKTKYLSEQVLKNQNFQAIILRPRAIIGAGDVVIMPRILRAYQENKLRLPKTSPVVNVTSIENLAELIYLGLNADLNAQYTVFNVANEAPVQLGQLINDILTALGLAPPPKNISPLVLYIAGAFYEFFFKLKGSSEEPPITRYGATILSKSFTMNLSKVQAQLGYKALVDTPHSVLQYVDWYQGRLTDTRFFPKP